MQRKIIKQGNGSFTFTLPIDWVTKENLDAGDTIEVTQNEHGLILQPKTTSRQPKETTIKLSVNEGAARSQLSQAYWQGFDKIIIECATPKQLKYANELVQKNLLGFEIIEQNATTCTAENISEPSPEKFQPILRKLFFIIKNEAATILTELETNEYNTAERKEQKHQVDTYTNYLRRMLIREAIAPKAESEFLFHTLSMISQIHHSYYYLHERMARQKTPILTNLINELKNTIHMIDTIPNILFGNSSTNPFELHAHKQKYFNKLFNSMITTKGVDNIAHYHLAEISRFIEIAASAATGAILKKQ